MRFAPTSAAFIGLLGVLAGLPALSIDLSAPTLVVLPAALGTTTMVAGLTLSLFMLGFALGQLGCGRASDRHGRRPVLLATLVLYTLGGAASGLAFSGAALAVSRLLQGAGAGGCAVLAYAIVQDLFQGEAARTRRSYVTAVLGIVPVLAPALGTWLGATWGWRSVHLVLAAAGLGLLCLVAVSVGESWPGTTPTEFGGARRLRDDGHFMSLAVVNALSYGALFAYIAGAPFVVMGQLGYKPLIYAGLFAATALALSAGAWTSARLGKRGFGACQLAWPGLAAQAGACLVLALYSSGIRARGADVLVPVLLLTCFARGLAAPNLVHLAIGPRRENAGLASAVLGVVQLLVGAAASAVVALLLPILGPAGATAPMAVLGAAAAALWLLVPRPEPHAVPRAADGP